MNKLLAGQYYYVSNISEIKALECKLRCRFVGYRKNKKMVFEGKEIRRVFERLFAVPIPEKKLDPWTLETFPMEAVWVRPKNHIEKVLVTGISGGGVSFEGGGYLDWLKLSETHERITNDSIEPCGVYNEN